MSAIQSHVWEKKSRFRPVSKIIRAPVMGCVKNAWTGGSAERLAGTQ